MMKLEEYKKLIECMPVANHASTANRLAWASYISKEDAAGIALRSIFGESDEVTISRDELRNLAKATNLEQFVMAVIVWGYPSGMRGNNFKNLITKIDELTKLLSLAKEKQVVDWKAHYSRVKPIKGIGLSTYTKFLSFLSIQVEGHAALILDDRIISVANKKVFEELGLLKHLCYQNAPKNYPQYLKCMHEFAQMHSVNPEQVEFFLFEFGLNLKPQTKPA